VTIWDAVRVQDQLRHEGHERVEGRIRSLPLWSEYVASLFEAKVAEGKLSSSKSRERWGNVLKRLIPVFGRLRVDELRTADVVAWRDQVARWIRDGMPSTRKRRSVVIAVVVAPTSTAEASRTRASRDAARCAEPRDVECITTHIRTLSLHTPPDPRHVRTVPLRDARTLPRRPAHGHKRGAGTL
jgi:hypothetical protein